MNNKIKRTDYLDGSPTPLFRGIKIFIFGIYSLYILLYYSIKYTKTSKINIKKTILFYGFFVNCLISFLYHNIDITKISSKKNIKEYYEKQIRKLDHIAINLVFLTNVVPFYDKNYIFHLLPHISTSLLDNYMLLKYNDYINSLSHIKKQSLLLTLNFLYLVYLLRKNKFTNKKLRYLLISLSLSLIGNYQWLSSNKDPPLGLSSNKDPSLGLSSDKDPPLGLSSNKDPPLGLSSDKDPSLGLSSNKDPPLGLSSDKDLSCLSSNKDPSCLSSNKDLSCLSSNKDLSCLSSNKDPSCLSSDKDPPLGLSFNKDLPTSGLSSNENVLNIIWGYHENFHLFIILSYIMLIKAANIK
jgi:hypothetical protein